MNGLPNVKGFIENIAPLYPIEVVFTGGDPAAYFLDKEGKEWEVIPLEGFSEEEIITVFEKRGFKKFELTNVKLIDE